MLISYCCLLFHFGGDSFWIPDCVIPDYRHMNGEVERDYKCIWKVKMIKESMMATEVGNSNGLDAESKSILSTCRPTF